MVATLRRRDAHRARRRCAASQHRRAQRASGATRSARVARRECRATAAGDRRVGVGRSRQVVEPAERLQFVQGRLRRELGARHLRRQAQRIECQRGRRANQRREPRRRTGVDRRRSRRRLYAVARLAGARVDRAQQPRDAGRDTADHAVAHAGRAREFARRRAGHGRHRADARAASCPCDRDRANPAQPRGAHRSRARRLARALEHAERRCRKRPTIWR